MEASKLNEILDQHKLWIAAKGGSRADLKNADLRGANLEDADLYRADLTGANLWGANLRDANLEGANLTRANLTHANLWRANLTGAILRGANLWGANLWGANLTGANLYGADLTGADLIGANLTNAILPDISWIIPGCLAQLNKIKYAFYLAKDGKRENFIQDSIGFFIQNNPEEGTFDMLVEDRIIRNIPDWVKLSGLRQTSAEPI
jgi:hypothetical protein